MSEHSHDPADATFVSHCVLLENHDQRIEKVEVAVDKVADLLDKHGTTLQDLSKSLIAMDSTFRTLKPIVYSILGVSVLAFLGALFDFIYKMGHTALSTGMMR